MIKNLFKFYLAIHCMLLMQISQAEPYKPINNEMVLTVISQHKQVKKLAYLTRTLKQQPDNINLLDELLSGYMNLGRSQADERYFAYAEALLKPYINKNTRDEILLVHWADILQRRHEFKKSQDVLAVILNNNPANIRARLMRAVIAQAKGDYSAAMKDCRALLGRVDLLVVTTCVTQIKSLTGQLDSSQKLLGDTYNRYPGNGSEEKSWAVTILAEMSMRSGVLGESEKWIQSGLAINPEDYYLLALYADLMINTNRPEAVADLLARYKHVDKLLLRMVIAEVALKKGGSENMHDLDVRINRAKQFKNASHLRLLARYYLDVKNDPVRALDYAKKNWESQREPDDIVILARSLRAANDGNGLVKLKAWLIKSGMEDKRLDDILLEQGFI